MTEQELITSKKSAQRTRLATLQELRFDNLKPRARKQAIKTLELCHENIMLANFHLDLIKVTK